MFSTLADLSTLGDLIDRYRFSPPVYPWNIPSRYDQCPHYFAPTVLTVPSVPRAQYRWWAWTGRSVCAEAKTALKWLRDGDWKVLMLLCHAVPCRAVLCCAAPFLLCVLACRALPCCAVRCCALGGYAHIRLMPRREDKVKWGLAGFHARLRSEQVRAGLVSAHTPWAEWEGEASALADAANERMEGTAAYLAPEARLSATRTSTHAHTRTHVHAHTSTHAHTRTHTHAHAQARTRRRAHSCARFTHAPTSLPLPRPSAHCRPAPSARAEA